jgi:hypothetical protein
MPQQSNEALPVLQGDVDLKPFDTLANIVEGLTLQTQEDIKLENKTLAEQLVKEDKELLQGSMIKLTDDFQKFKMEHEKKKLT